MCGRTESSGIDDFFHSKSIARVSLRVAFNYFTIHHNDLDCLKIKICILY
jgi:hypothetical protein